ncbi:uncharacterized protein LOC132700829 [Cylas formicarius]|uniref:uncharacterized protein LOC132700829 n=1 Tax=Cylas formicarius TaxID=197179 RepID=UPI0029583434|nr:uncharacterized protein LOC132700829 [Cylas formicarius]
MKVLLFYSLSLLGLARAALVTTQHGQLQGFRFSGPDDPPVYAYLGIPYGVAPIGDLRFQETQILDKWDGVLNATTEGSYCISTDFFSQQDKQSEDCLFLNIYSPSENLSANYPVMAYIHGGNYINGNAGPAFFDPSPIVADDVIVAIFQYRVGPYGFLSTKDLVIPGNAGLKDQVLALRWIKENIAAFGGDPEKITLFGESAGGSSAGLHVLSKKSTGLFRAVMAQSGSALTPFSIHRHPREFAYRLANQIDSSISEDTHNSSQLAAFLGNQSPGDIINASLALTSLFEKQDITLKPTIEVEHDGAFLSENPYDLLISGDFYQVPYFSGITSEESLFFLGTLDSIKAEADRLDNEEGYIYPYDFEPRNASDENEIVDFIRGMYLNGSSNFSDELYSVIKYKSDDLISRGVIKHAELASAFVDVYFYQFSYNGNLSRTHVDLPGAEGKAVHSDELGYLFNRQFFSDRIPTETDLLVKSRMVRLWTNFAKFLNPTPEDDELLQNLRWPTAQPGDLQYLNINATLEVDSNPKGDTYPQWNFVYDSWNTRAALVTTQHGQLQGFRFSGPDDPLVYAYLGIPYGVPPIGELRFQETQILDKWEGVLNATTEGKYCIGDDYARQPEKQGEDCLFLNVYSPSENISGNYPIMAYIHGGRYVNGNAGPAAFDPSPMVAEGVIVAIFQYRMGPYGFLSTKDLVVPGNAGLKDQVLALRWIKDNIAAFGGDPEQITIFGESAGGSACGLHVVSKKSAGLFRAAICQSASALTPFSIHRHPKEYAYQLANLIDESVSEENHDSSQLAEFLGDQSPATIINASLVLNKILEKEDNYLAPTIEVEHDSAFLYQSPYELLSNGDFNRVPYLAGHTSEESLFFMFTFDIIRAEAKKLDNETGYIYPYDFEPRNKSDEAEIIQYIRDMYLNDSSSFSDDLYAVIKGARSQTFCSYISTVFSCSIRGRVLLYQFSYNGNPSRSHLNIPGAEGQAEHSDELGYLFNRQFLSARIPTDNDLLVKSRMVRLWTNFAKFLDPTPEDDDLLQNLKWPKAQAGDLLYLNINATLEVDSNPKGETYSKWNTVYNNWNTLPLTTF